MADTPDQNSGTAAPDRAPDRQAQPGDPFVDGSIRVEPSGEGEDALIVDVNGFEGPLDLLLNLARHQKVDLAQISILALAEQYLTFIAQIRKMRLELAADYLVMAAWLAYLKSRLLLPEPPPDDDEPTGEELAAHLAFRLQRLEAMREAAAALMTRNRLGRDIFPRGAPEGIRVDRKQQYTAELYDLLKAYSVQREKDAFASYRIKTRPVFTLGQARDTLRRLVGNIADWAQLDELLAHFVMAQGVSRRSAVASAFGASLELVREGVVELRQQKAFSPLYMRPRPAGSAPVQVAEGGDQ